MKLKSLLLICFILAGASAFDFISAQEKIDINTAPLEELVKIIHIGEARARELISLRPFSSLDELTEIKGIGEARLEDIKKQGLSWVETTSTIAPTESSLNLTQSSLEPESAEARPPQVLVETRADAEAKNVILPSPAEDSDTSFLTLAAAVFTSFLSGGIILILKHVRT